MDGALHAAGPDFVYIGLPFPKASGLALGMRDVMPATWFVGLGISFSFVCGDVRRAQPGCKGPDWNGSIDWLRSRGVWRGDTSWKGCHSSPGCWRPRSANVGTPPNRPTRTCARWRDERATDHHARTRSARVERRAAVPSPGSPTSLLAGGGTDVASFFEREGGLVLSATINRYAHGEHSVRGTTTGSRSNRSISAPPSSTTARTQSSTTAASTSSRAHPTDRAT